MHDTNKELVTYFRHEAKNLRKDLEAKSEARQHGALYRLRRGAKAARGLSVVEAKEKLTELDFLDTIAFEQDAHHWRNLKARLEAPGFYRATPEHPGLPGNPVLALAQSTDAEHEVQFDLRPYLLRAEIHELTRAAMGGASTGFLDYRAVLALESVDPNVSGFLVLTEISEGVSFHAEVDWNEALDWLLSYRRDAYMQVMLGINPGGLTENYLDETLIVPAYMETPQGKGYLFDASVGLAGCARRLTEQMAEANWSPPGPTEEVFLRSDRSEFIAIADAFDHQVDVWIHNSLAESYLENHHPDRLPL